MAMSLGDEINAATKLYHTTLNQQILHFLPYSLPPLTPTTHLYALGISHFKPLYAIFERSLRTHISSNTLAPRLKQILQKLHLPQLERAQALQQDLTTLLPPSYHVPHHDMSPRLQAFQNHVQTSLNEKPHLLFAYTWIFYMALFSGGRYIRSKLRAAFTSTTVSTSTPQAQLDALAGFSFWDFPGDLDGEDLKIDFKARVTALSDSLTSEERKDIADEGVRIMIALTDIVSEVAETVPVLAQSLSLSMSAADSVEVKGPVARIRPPWILLLKYLFPMSAMDFLGAVIGMAILKSHASVAPIQALPVTTS
ncbi:MAG: hypothetical protein Q9220_000728 [cf. Caloplaca sp. 1 TL-2023]